MWPRGRLAVWIAPWRRGLPGVGIDRTVGGGPSYDVVLLACSRAGGRQRDADGASPATPTTVSTKASNGSRLDHLPRPRTMPALRARSPATSRGRLNWKRGFGV